MSEAERQQRINELTAALSKPGGAQAFRFVLGTLGAAPWIGGAISAVGAFSAEREQGKVNTTFLDWARLADTEIALLSDGLRELLATPNRASMLYLLGEILGEPAFSELLDGDVLDLPIVLNPATVQDLEPFIAQGWLELKPTGAICAMGAGNRVGNHSEDRKRPYGMGSGFVLKLTTPTSELECTRRI